MVSFYLDLSSTGQVASTPALTVVPAPGFLGGDADDSSDSAGSVGGGMADGDDSDDDDDDDDSGGRGCGDDGNFSDGEVNSCWTIPLL